jgi:hypothetical protein
MSSMRSGAPLTNIQGVAVAVAVQVAMKRCCDSNGMESVPGPGLAPMCGWVKPALPPSTSSAPSVGSPTTRHTPSSRSARRCTARRRAMPGQGAG